MGEGTRRCGARAVLLFRHPLVGPRPRDVGLSGGAGASPFAVQRDRDSLKSNSKVKSDSLLPDSNSVGSVGAG